MASNGNFEFCILGGQSYYSTQPFNYGFHVYLWSVCGITRRAYSKLCKYDYDEAD